MDNGFYILSNTLIYSFEIVKINFSDDDCFDNTPLYFVCGHIDFVWIGFKSDIYVGRNCRC